jgi:O-acetyl-ADP-ribose deacetylase
MHLCLVSLNYTIKKGKHRLILEVFGINKSCGGVWRGALTLESGYVKIVIMEVWMNSAVTETKFPSGQKLQIVQGDITEEKVDAIVNAANSTLLHGGGVAGVIVRKGGDEIQSESKAWVEKYGPVSHAEPAYTGAGNLPCRYIIHAVGPIWGEGDEDEKLGSAVTGSLRLADRLQLESLATPAISTGIFGFPVERAAKVILNAIQDYFLLNPDSGVRLVRVILYDHSIVKSFLDVWQTWSEDGESRGMVQAK